MKSLTQVSSMIQLSELQLPHILKAFPKGLVALDLETTGLSPLMDRIIEFAAIKVTPEGQEKLATLINPKITIPAETVQFHGITDQDVAHAPTLKEFIPQILDFIGDLPVVAHNAKFDWGFLTFSLHQLGLKYPQSPVHCSIKMARSSFDNMDSYKLSFLADSLQIPLESHHRALDDTLACLLIFEKSLGNLSAQQLPKAIKESFLFKGSDFAKNKHLNLEEHLKILQKKVRKQQVIKIKYKGGTHKNILRPIRATSLLPMPEGDVLYAHCLLTDMYKSFALRKIKEVQEVTGEEIKDILAKLEKLRESR